MERMEEYQRMRAEEAGRPVPAELACLETRVRARAAGERARDRPRNRDSRRVRRFRFIGKCLLGHNLLCNPILRQKGGGRKARPQIVAICHFFGRDWLRGRPQASPVTRTAVP